MNLSTFQWNIDIYIEQREMQPSESFSWSLVDRQDTRMSRGMSYFWMCVGIQPPRSRHPTRMSSEGKSACCFWEDSVVDPNSSWSYTRDWLYQRTWFDQEYYWSAVVLRETVSSSPDVPDTIWWWSSSCSDLWFETNLDLRGCRWSYRRTKESVTTDWTRQRCLHACFVCTREEDEILRALLPMKHRFCLFICRWNGFLSCADTSITHNWIIAIVRIEHVERLLLPWKPVW